MIFIDVTILLTCLNFDTDIKPTTICIKLLKYQYNLGILYITSQDMMIARLTVSLGGSSDPDDALYEKVENVVNTIKVISWLSLILILFSSLYVESKIKSKSMQ